MTIVVVSLLAIAAASNDRTNGYYYFGQSNLSGRLNADDYRDRIEVSTLDFATRVRVTLHQAPSGTPTQLVTVEHLMQGTWAERQDVLRTTPGRQGREHALEFSAILFALFGLFVLWWGRDRASLWLGLFCASFAPPIFDHYCILPVGWTLLASLVADFLFFLSIYAFFEIAETFALEAMQPGDPFRNRIERFRELALATVAFAALVNFANTIAPVEFGESVWDWVEQLGTFAHELAIVAVLGLGPIVLLAIGLWRAAGGEARSRVRVTLITTLAAESGVLAAIGLQIAQGRPLSFSNSWYTLLAIPIGFLFSIPAYKVVEVKVVLNRILVFTTMTAVIAAVITATETWVDKAMKDQVPDYILTWFGRATDTDKSFFAETLRFTVAFAIVLGFSRFHHSLETFFENLFFRRRDEAVESLRGFVRTRVQFITSREEMLQQAVKVVRKALGARGAAFYEESPGGYSQAATDGDTVWPEKTGENDPAFVTMRGGVVRVPLQSLEPTTSELGKEGLALRMAVSNHVIGALIVGARVRESEGPYEREELEALEEFARSVADALAYLRAADTAEFVRGVADGSLRGLEAANRAAALCARGRAGADASIRPVPEPRQLPQISAQ
jgi:hypothetical protein